MSDLDKKLEELFVDYNEDFFCLVHATKRWDSDCEIIKQIKQAFIDDGWVQTLKYDTKTVVLNGKDKLGYIVYYPAEVMTGQEWYDRFQDEYAKLRRPKDDYREIAKNVTEAARKAAGIEE